MQKVVQWVMMLESDYTFLTFLLLLPLSSLSVNEAEHRQTGCARPPLSREQCV